MPRRSRPPRPVPSSPAAWLQEIALAYCDAEEAIPFAELLGDDVGGHDLFQLAPIVCLKFRGLRRTKKRLRQATEAALTSFVVSTTQTPELERHPPLAFAFCYLASHFGLDLATEAQVDEVMEYLVANEADLREAIIGADERDP